MKICTPGSRAGRFTMRTCRMDHHRADTLYIQAGVNSLEISQSFPYGKHTVISIPEKLQTRLVGWLSFLFISVFCAVIAIKQNAFISNCTMNLYKHLHRCDHNPTKGLEHLHDPEKSHGPFQELGRLICKYTL